MRKLNATLSRHKFEDDESLKPGMLAWAASVNRAAEAGDSQKLKQLQEVVTKKPQKLEDQEASFQAKAWRKALAKPPQSNTAPPG